MVQLSVAKGGVVQALPASPASPSGPEASADPVSRGSILAHVARAGIIVGCVRLRKNVRGANPDGISFLFVTRLSCARIGRARMRFGSRTRIMDDISIGVDPAPGPASSEVLHEQARPPRASTRNARPVRALKRRTMVFDWRT